MAQTTGPGSRARGGTSASSGTNGAKTSASTNGANGANGAGGTSDGGARRGFNLSLSSLSTGLSTLFGPRQTTATNGRNGASGQQQRPNTGMGKFLKGWLILVVGMYVVQFALIILDANAFGGWLEKHYIAGTDGGLKPGSAFLLGGMTWFLLIFIALFAGLYYALVKFKILPKDLFGGARGQAQANARGAGGASTGSRTGSTNGRAASPSSPPPLPSGVNPYADHSRAARREAQRRALATAAAPQPKRGLFGRSKPAAPVATAATAASSSTAGRKPVRAPEAVAAAANPGDSHYQRVRIQQQQRKRRAARR